MAVQLVKELLACFETHTLMSLLMSVHYRTVG